MTDDNFAVAINFLQTKLASPVLCSSIITFNLQLVNKNVTSFDITQSAHRQALDSSADFQHNRSVFVTR